MTKKEKNIAFIDGQNLHMGTFQDGWQTSHRKFRKYLKSKYKVTKAYYFLGFLDETQKDMYEHLQSAGFIVVFREHNAHMKGKKKGNVDVDIVFEVMHRLLKRDDFEDVVLVTGDGDYIKLVNFLLDEKRLEKILFPNNRYSSLYKKIASEYGINIGLPEVRKKIEYKKKECP